MAQRETKQAYIFNGSPINLSALARDTGVTPGQISLVFSGRRTPSLPLAKRLANTLGMSLDQYLSDLERHIINTSLPKSA